MPEVTVQEKWATQVPRFTLPAEFSNEPKPEPAKEPAKPEVKPEIPAEPPKEAKEVAEAATPEPEKTEPESPETEPDKEKATSRRFERRIDRAHRRAAEAQARAEFLEKQLAELKSQGAPKTPSAAPRMEDYTDVQEYAKAYAAFEKDQALKDYQRKQQEDTQKAQIQKVSEEWEAQASKASNKYEDWDEVVGELKPTQPWSVAIMRSENGADVAYHLGKHPTEARKILSLDPYSQILEIGRLSAKLSQAAPERPKTPSKAPAPINPVQTESKASGDDIRPDQPFEEYRKIGNKLFRGKR